jgi:hypothetical protein
MYQVATVLRLTKALTIGTTPRAIGYILTAADVTTMKTLQSLVAKRWVVPVPDPSARRLGTKTTYSSNTSVAGQPTYLNPSVTKGYASTNKPAAPTSLAGTSTVTTQIDLTWTAPAVTADANSAITDYKIQYKLTGTDGYTNVTRSASTTATQAVTGLTVGKTYDLRVASISANGTGPYGNVVQVKSI